MKLTIHMTPNGMKSITISPAHGRGFTIQTNGNLPRTHRDGIGGWTWREIATYVLAHGTDRQRDIIKKGV